VAAELKPKLVLVGFMGAGKSTVARSLGPRAVDTDEVFVERHGSIADYFDREGEPAFRAAEEELVLATLRREEVEVVALGGGAVTSPEVRAALERHRVVFLDVPFDEARSRCAGPDRPLTRDPERFAALYAARRPLYEQIAHVTVPAGGRVDPKALLPAIDALDGAPEGTRLVFAAVGGRVASPVYFGAGLVAGRFRPRVGGPDLLGRAFLVTDGAVARRYGEHFADAAGRVAIMPGEASKTVAHAEIVWTELARTGLTRADHVLALGGGVVGDLAGFCAATYQRGVPVVQIPTTLVAQVDSAYGGKTGVDLPEAKNYVGAYHQPAAVVTDPATLATLPPEERAAGYAEVVKTALIAGGPLWERVRGGAVDDPETVLRCARTKLDIVAADERDDGRRQVLNLGHTVGHAIETATGYAAYRHGEAVALGLLAALRLSGQDDLRAEVAELLAAQGLPHQLTGCSPEAVVDAVARDKKRLGEAPVPFVLVHAPGDVRPGETVGPGALRAVVEELAA
jgi:shikimate kinase/3-dehydroquinate synthase